MVLIRHKPDGNPARWGIQYMIYKYYCMDCGNHFNGEEIKFDLGEILGFRGDSSQRADAESPAGDMIHTNSRAMQIGSNQLIALAKKNRVELKHGQRVKLRVSLRDFLMIMGANVGREQNREKLLVELMNQSKHSDLRNVLREVYSTGESLEVEEQMIGAFKAQIDTIFPLSEEAEKYVWENESKPEKKDELKIIRDSNANYMATVYLEPEFFDNGRSPYLYTVRYTKDPGAAVLNTPAAPLEIRGYCPKCGKPVVVGAGKYPHKLIGLLGVQSAGKTSLVVAMVRELQASYGELGVAYPGQLLCDSRYEIMKTNFELYDNGWAVGKTPIIGTGGTFNATLLLSSRDGQNKKLITFADIAGELCYDIDKRAVNVRAFNQFPLVKACDMYVMCSCIDQTGYGNADGKVVKRMPPEAPLDITISMYNTIANDPALGGRIPPLCIVLTKTDMVGRPQMNKDPENPVDKIQKNRNYEFLTQLENLSMTYDSFQSQNIREPIRRACALFTEMKERTYVTLMSCSALGRKGSLYTGNMDMITPYVEDGEEKPFERIRLKDLWSWIVQTAGLAEVGTTGMTLKGIPSFREKYARTAGNPDMYSMTVPDIRRRLNCISQLFMNMSFTDRSLVEAIYGQIHVGIFQKEENVRKEKVEEVLTAQRALV